VNRTLIVGLVLVALMGLAVLLGPTLAPHSPTEGSRFHIIPQPGAESIWLSAPFAPSWRHPLGTDDSGRDLFSRLLVGARYTWLVAMATVGLRVVLAVPLALYFGWGSRRPAVGRAAVVGETSLGAFPALVVAFFVLTTARALLLTPLESYVWYCLTVALVGAPPLISMLRRRTADLASRPFIEGAAAAGARPWRIVWRHVFPHLLVDIGTALPAQLSQVFILMAQLAVFGISLGGSMVVEGVDGRLRALSMFPEWGAMLAQGIGWVRTAPWVPFVPAAAFFVSLLALALAGEGLGRMRRGA